MPYFTYRSDPNFRNSCGRANLQDTDRALSRTGRVYSITCRDGVRYTAEVGSFALNPIGLHDMIGNVAELSWPAGSRPTALPRIPMAAIDLCLSWGPIGDQPPRAPRPTLLPGWTGSTRKLAAQGIATAIGIIAGVVQVGWFSRRTRRFARSAAMTSQDAGRRRVARCCVGAVNVIPLIRPTRGQLRGFSRRRRRPVRPAYSDQISPPLLGGRSE